MLAFGYNKGLPEGTDSAWGARLIYPSDLLWDRQGTFGPRSQELCSKLDGGILKLALERADYLNATREMRPEQNREFTLYEDGEVVVKASPSRSYGYLYVCAYFS